MSYFHPTAMHPALARHHASGAHRLMTDPVVLPADGTVSYYHPTAMHPALRDC